MLTQFLDEEPARPEVYYVLISHHLTVASAIAKPAAEYQSALNIADKLYKNV